MKSTTTSTHKTTPFAIAILPLVVVTPDEEPVSEKALERLCSFFVRGVAGNAVDIVGRREGELDGSSFGCEVDVGLREGELD